MTEPVAHAKLLKLPQSSRSTVGAAARPMAAQRRTCRCVAHARTRRGAGGEIARVSKDTHVSRRLAFIHAVKAHYYWLVQSFRHDL